jgi:hypothetical protein
MGAKLNSYIKQNIESYFQDNEDGTVTIKFGGGEPLVVGSSTANTLKTLITKKLSARKTKMPGSGSTEAVDRLNQIAHSMIQGTKLTPEQRKEIELDKIVKKIK